jgi:hypothetical protein
MKGLLIASALILSTSSAFAIQITGATTLAPTLSTSVEKKILADAIVNDTQEFIQTGKMSALLAQKVSELKEIESSLSTEDALDALIDSAAEILAE